MMLNIKKDFPMLQREISEHCITYLDSAAASFKPLSVIDSERLYGLSLTSNVHRSHNALSDEVSYQYETTRRKIAEFIHGDAETVIITPNTSYALNMIAKGLDLSKNDTVLCSIMNHHSNLLPWMNIAKVVYFESENLEPLSLDAVITAIKLYRPKILSISYVCHLNGIINPITEICKIAREYNVITVIDAAQAAPHLPIDVLKLDCDFLAFSGHKILGPTGTGILYGKYQLLKTLNPLVLGGGTVDSVTCDEFILKSLPHCFEPGTPNISGVLGLGEAVNYIENIGFDSIRNQEEKLINALHDSLTDIPGVKILSGKNKYDCVAIASIVLVETSINSDMLCQMLSDNFQIITRSGFHCAHQFFNKYQYNKGALRISAYIYNTVEDIYKASDAIRMILKKFT